MIRQHLNVRVGELTADVHVRTDRVWKTDYHTIDWMGVYVRPVGPVPGYWYFPEGPDAVALLTSVGVTL